jgi:hypothetical protein
MPSHGIKGWHALALALVSGLALGLWDITQTKGIQSVENVIYFAAAALLSLLHPTTSWLTAIILAGSLYVVHVVALACGMKQPYVEKDYFGALSCWLLLVPSMGGVLTGVPPGLLMAYFSKRHETDHHFVKSPQSHGPGVGKAGRLPPPPPDRRSLHVPPTP